MIVRAAGSLTVTDTQRYRLRFCKRDRLRFISHHDVMQVFERALRRADFHVAHSHGFNPRPRLVFALALPLGVESHDEVVDIELKEAPDPRDFLSRLSAQLPEQLRPFSCVSLGASRAAPRVAACRYSVELPRDLLAGAREALERYAASDDPSITRTSKGNTRDIRLKRYVSNLRIEDERLAFDLSYPLEGGMKPAELLTWLGLDPTALLVIKHRTVLEGES